MNISSQNVLLPSPIPSSSPMASHKKSWLSKHPNQSMTFEKPQLGQFVLTPEPSSNTFYAPSSPASAVRREPLSPMSFVRMRSHRVNKIGRSSQQCDHVLSTVDKAISRVHAIVTCTQDRMIIECVGWNGMIVSDKMRKSVFHMKKNDRIVLVRPNSDACPVLDVFGYRVLLGWPSDSEDEWEGNLNAKNYEENREPMSPSPQEALPLMPSSPPSQDYQNDQNHLILYTNSESIPKLNLRSNELVSPPPSKDLLQKLLALEKDGQVEKSDYSKNTQLKPSFLPKNTDNLLNGTDDNNIVLREVKVSFENEKIESDDLDKNEEISEGEEYTPIEESKEPITVRRDSVIQIDESSAGLTDVISELNFTNHNDDSKNSNITTSNDSPVNEVEPMTPELSSAVVEKKEPEDYESISAVDENTNDSNESLPSNHDYSESTKENSAPDSLLLGLVLDELVFSTTSTTPLPALSHLFPSNMPLQLIQDKLRDLAAKHPYFEEVKRYGTDANGDPLWSEWFYNPDVDDDLERRMRYAPLMRPVRSSRRVHKQYYWKKPRARPRSSGHSSRRRRLS
ncbi:Transcription factor P14E8.02 [Schizosaccharomyces pombe]